LAAVALLTGCGREEIRAYRAPKDPAHQPPMAHGHGSEWSTPRLRWELPAGWQELPAGQMRVGYFAVTGQTNQKAEVTIIPLPGMAGGDLENVNRWRAQVGLAPVQQAELSKLTEAIQVGGQAGQLYDFAGAPYDRSEQSRLLVAVLRSEGTAWFFKMLGDDALVAQQKPVFVEFLKALAFEKATAGPAVGAAPDQPTEAASHSGWTATAPADWQQQSPAPMQAAKFTVAAPSGGQAEITVVMLPGDAGGTLANVNRWRQQIGLGPVSEGELTQLVSPLEVAGAKGLQVDMTADKTKRRMVAAVVSRGAETWFYKLVGDEAVVGKQKAPFLQFVQGAKYGS
jgi:hypothetical protein